MAEPKIVHDALTTLYDVAIGASDNGDMLRATQAYAVLVDFIADCQFPDPEGVDPQRVLALGRLLLDSGDITMMGARMLEKIATQGEN